MPHASQENCFLHDSVTDLDFSFQGYSLQEALQQSLPVLAQFPLIWPLWILTNPESQAGLCMGVWNKLSGEVRKSRDLKIYSGAFPLFTALLELLEKQASS